MNSMMQFVKSIYHVFKKHISHVCNQFFDNINVKKSKTDYEKKKALSEIQ